MGVSADSSQRAFPSADIEAFKKRAVTSFPEDVFGDRRFDVSHFVVVRVSHAYTPLLLCLNAFFFPAGRRSLRRWKLSVRGLQHRPAHLRDRRGGAGS